MNTPQPVLDSNADTLLKTELLRIRAYLLLWATPAILLLLFYVLGVLTDHTELPNFVVQELEKPLETHGLLATLCLTLIAFCLAWIVGATNSARVIAEDIGSILYLAGTFCLDVGTVISLIHFKLLWPSLLSMGVGALAIVLGMLLQTFGEAAVRKRESKHVWGWVKRTVRRQSRG